MSTRKAIFFFDIGGEATASSLACTAYTMTGSQWAMGFAEWVMFVEFELQA